MLTLLRWFTVGLGFLATGGTLLSFSKSNHWFVRLWDFPRVQITASAGLSATLFRSLFFRGRISDWAFLGANLLCLLWQGRKIYPYTPLAVRQVDPSRSKLPRNREERGRRTFRLLISNVLMENRAHDLLLQTVEKADPDVLLVVETDEAWERALRPLEQTYPHILKQPQDNYYGLILFSRLPLINPRVEFLIQDDIPSVHTEVELPSGDRVVLYGLHPRPPEPIRDQDSTPRDAELVVVGKAIGNSRHRPTVVAGDLNDVAWSPTSELFLRLSGLLDPRVGRGFYNSYNAKQPLMRYPLDHVFHSNHFRLVDLQRLPSIGSDHFPMLIELSLEPQAQAEQPPNEKRPGDEEQAQEKIEEQVEAARTGEDRPSRE